MHEHESIKEMFTRFITTVNERNVLGKNIQNIKGLRRL